ncbi:hypothetical protein [Leifsonia aquatica]|uniref:hypothetical protein n=1 Tax=Leifsonia aquatica TaxID=144185 RepID=UPI0028A98633|nr:hypothetical protein [Leifsonia aquatica]
MPSDTVTTSRLDTVRAALDTTLRPVLPDSWRTVPHLSAAAKLLVPGVYMEFTGISNQHGGQTLPPGLAFCDFDLSVVVPSTDDEKGEDDVDAAVVDLIAAMDAAESVAWDSAKKERLEDGRLLWKLTLAVITHTN